MKKVITLFAGIVITAASFAQVSIGLQASGNLSEASLEVADLLPFSKKAKVFPAAGVVADVKISPHVMVRTGVNFLQHGIKLSTTFAGTPGEVDEIRAQAKSTLNYLQVPLNVTYTTKGAFKLFVGGGPYLSFGISGKSKQETTTKYSDGSTETEKEETAIFKKDDNGDASFKRLDYGLGAVAGIKFGNVFANVGYQLSLDNISKTEGQKYKNRGLQLSVGYYLFGR